MKKSLFVLLLFSVGIFSGCGGAEESASSSIEISTFPGAIIDADFTLGTGDNQTSVTGASFNVNLTGTNNSEKNLFIVSLSGELTGDQNYEWAIDLPDDASTIGFATPGNPIAWMVNESLSGGALILSTYVDSLPKELNSFRVKFTASGFFTEQDNPDTPVNEIFLPSENFEKTFTVTVKR